MKKVVIGLLCLAVGLVIGAVVGSPQVVLAEGPAVGRYQLDRDDSGNVFVIDSTNGQVLRWTRNRENKLAWLVVTPAIDE